MGKQGSLNESYEQLEYGVGAGDREGLSTDSGNEIQIDRPADQESSQSQNQQQQPADSNQYYYDYNAAYDAGSDWAAAIEAKRQEIAEENEKKHRENDERNREAELEKQKEEGQRNTPISSSAQVASADTSNTGERSRESSVSGASSMQPVSIQDADGNEVVLDEVTGNILKGQETAYGNWLASLTADERRTFATQSRIAQASGNQNQLEEQGVDAVEEPVEQQEETRTEGTPEFQEDEIEYTQESLQGMTVKELKKLLKQRSLKVSGRKAELIDRLIKNSGSSLFSQSNENQQPEQEKGSDRLHEIFANQKGGKRHDGKYPKYYKTVNGEAVEVSNPGKLVKFIPNRDPNLDLEIFLGEDGHYQAYEAGHSVSTRYGTWDHYMELVNRNEEVAQQDEETSASKREEVGQDNEGAIVPFENVATLYIPNDITVGNNSSGFSVSFNKENGKLVELDAFGKYREIEEQSDLPERVATPEARLKELHLREKFLAEIDERRKNKENSKEGQAEQNNQQQLDELVSQEDQDNATRRDSRGYRIVDGFDHIVEGKRFYHPKDGQVTDEFLKEVQALRKEWLGGHMYSDVKWNILKDIDANYVPVLSEDVWPKKQQQTQSNSQQQEDAYRQDSPSQSDEEPSMWDQVDEFFQRTSQQRIAEGRKANRRAEEDWYRDHPEAQPGDYELSDEYWEDAEAFAQTLKSMFAEQYIDFGDVTMDSEGNFVDRQGNPIDALKGAGLTSQERLNQMRLIQSVVRSFKIGFFHVKGENLVTDKETGKQNLKWSKPVNDRIIRLSVYLGMDPNQLDSQRTVFRLVTLYACMGVDRHGKMFGEDSGEWSLEAKEFCDICDMILVSCMEKGHPLMPPWRTSYGSSELRGTDIVPSGVLPAVVANAITGERSQLRIDGKKPDAKDLAKIARRQWVTDTYPWIKENLKDEPQRGEPELDENGDPVKHRSKYAQRVCIEDMNQALARIGHLDAKAFSKLYGIDTDPHYRIEEYRNTHKVYAQAVGEKFVDMQAVSDYQDALLEEIMGDAADHHSQEYGLVECGLNVITGGIRTNALFWNVPIAVSAIAEKGVGDVQTDFAIRSIMSRTERVTGVGKMDVNEDVRNAFKTAEAHEAIEGALYIMDVWGPQGLIAFAERNGDKPLTPETAVEFLNRVYLPIAKTKNAAKARDIQRKLSKMQQKIMTGDIAFKNYDAKNFLNAFLACNQVLLGAQTQLAEQGLVDSHAGVAFTGEEIEDVFLACNGDVARFMTQMLKVRAGSDALIMMRSNNIGNFNPVSYAVNKVFCNTGLKGAFIETAITSILDSFPKYGINFLYAMTPFSRSLSYLAMKRMEASGDMQAGLLVPGGSLSDVNGIEHFREAYADPAFKAGLRINLLYDAMTFGRWSVTAIVLGGIMALLGLDPPDKPEWWWNVSRWKVGGQEIGMAYWINDLTQLGLPIAFGMAAMLSGQDSGTAAGLAAQSLYDQIDGNVILDFVKQIKGWSEEMEEIDKMATDPKYLSGFDPGMGLMELMLSVGDKVVPGAPLYRYIQNDVFFRGENATAKSPYKTFDKSEDWTKAVGKTDFVQDPNERMIRRHCTANWGLALYQDFVNGIIPNPIFGDHKDEKTGYFWWEMPDKSKSDQLILTWMATQTMDYTNREGCETDEAYKELKTDQLIKQIDEVTAEYGGLEQAIMQGYFISHDIRYASLEVLSGRLADLETNFQNRVDSGELPQYSQEFYSAKNDKDVQTSIIWKYIHILQSDDVPMWNEGYKQIISDKEVDYYHADGTSAMAWEWLFDTTGTITAEWKNKGNHPSALKPITFVDKTSDDLITRGFSGETVPFWAKEGENGGTDYEAIRNTIGKETIPMGSDAGKVLNDVLFGGQPDGSFLHPDQATIDDRAWFPVKGYLTDDIKNFDAAQRVKDLIAEADENIEDKKDKKDNPSNKTTYPRSFSGGGGGGSRRGGGSSSNYNPKIYSFKAQSTHNQGSRASATHVNPNQRSVNADRAATMYSKTPGSARANTYLHPSFGTKGSREAYKRQDI